MTQLAHYPLSLRLKHGVIARSGSDEAILLISLIPMVSKNYFVYVATNPSNTVLYTGVTNNLTRRIYEHKSKLLSSFTSKYNICKLVYYEIFDQVNDAIAREKQLKAGSRKRKIELIRRKNPYFNDLYKEIV